MKIKCFVNRKQSFTYSSDYVPRKDEQIVYIEKGWIVNYVSHDLDKKFVSLGLTCSQHEYEKTGEPGQFGQMLTCNICGSVTHTNHDWGTADTAAMLNIRIPEGKS